MRKKRVDSNAGEGEMFRTKKPAPPPHLRECDLPFWDKIVSARDFTSWNAIDLEYAANLAQMMARIRKLHEDIANEEDVVAGKRNPKHDLLDMLERRSLAMSRSIQVHSGATVGRASDMRKRNQKQKELIEDQCNYDEESLIPGIIQ